MANTSRIGYAVVGLGNLARNAILPAFAHSKRSKLVALVSRDPQKTATLQRKFQAVACFEPGSFDQCLARPDISAVYVVTPPGQHEEFTTRAASAKKHVICEKPLAATAAQSARMVAACCKNGVLLMTAYRKYFEPSSVYLKSLIASGALGRLDMMHTSFSELYNPSIAPTWLLDPSMSGGGPMMDLGVYCVNTTRWLAGEDPIEALAHSWRHDHDTMRFNNVEEGVSFRLNFPSGLIVQGSSTYSSAISSFIFIQGTKGWISLSPAYTYEHQRRVTGKISGRLIDKRFKSLDEFALELDAFSSAILHKKPVEPDGVQGHRDLLIIQAIYQSARTHQPVPINYLAKEQSHG
jgi:predicted dehydrogenase